MNIIGYMPGHLDFMEPREFYRDDPTLADRLTALFNSGKAELLTCVLDTQVVAILGFIMYWPGMGEMFSITSDRVKDCPLAFHKGCKGLVEERFKAYELKRLQVTVRDDFVDGYKWAEALGFKEEALLKNYGPDGHDYYMFARF